MPAMNIDGDNYVVLKIEKAVIKGNLLFVLINNIFFFSIKCKTKNETLQLLLSCILKIINEKRFTLLIGPVGNYNNFTCTKFKTNDRETLRHVVLLKFKDASSSADI